MISHVTRVFSLLCLLETGAMGDARLCTFEINGETKYYVCPRNEQCCKVGCCLSPSFQFYQLWYYWLMVIFMLVVCSGGQWWYKYWVGGGDRSGGVPTVMMRGTAASASQPPPRPRMGVVASSSAASSSTSASVPTSFTLIHQICKPHHYHSRGDGKVPSPYDQIYGPPPSYESVIGSSPAVLPPYSVSPEPPGASVQSGAVGGAGGGDPLGAVEHTQMRVQCPSYSQSQLDRQNETDSSADPSSQSPSLPPISRDIEQVSPRNRISTSADRNQGSAENGDDESNCDKDTTAPTVGGEATNPTTDSQAQTQRSSQCLEHQHH